MRKVAATAVLLIASSCIAAVAGFQLPLPKTLPTQSTPSFQKTLLPLSRSSSLGPLYFWGNKNKDDDADKSVSNKDQEENGGAEGLLGGLFPFFANNKDEKKEEKEAAEKEPTASTAVAVEKTAAASRPKRVARVVVPAETDPVKRAEALRAQAERARLEADRMDAELTLAKISRLEREMATAVAKDDTENIERLQREMDALQAKIRGEAPKAVVVPKRDDATTTSASTDTTSATTTPVATVKLGGNMDDVFKVDLDFSDTDFEGLVGTVGKSPGFMKKLFAQMSEVDFVTVDDINATEVATRLLQMQRMDFSYSSRPKPTFTQQDIEKAIQGKLFQEGAIASALDSNLSDSVKGNETAKALMALEYNYYVDAYNSGQMEQLLEGEDWLKNLVEAANKTEVDSSIEMLYPKCTRKEDGDIPTMAQVKMLLSDVLPKSSFAPRGQPEPVLGGYIVRGTSKFDSGDETIEAIDKQLENHMLKDKMTILLTKDFTLLADAQSREEGFGPDDGPPILYIMGPDIVPERQRIPLAVTTAFGIATSWYLSVYPFLLNPALLKRTEEQLELADASMAYDLGWLTELSLPLFVTFIGIQLAHEAGHKIAGAANGVSTTLPTFVPSLITGVTSAVTQFKEPPKNKEAMFDVAVAGPLAGIAASLFALVLGSQLTLISDPSVLPALPLDILRQSTLGGGIIDAILGSGALSVPYGAETSQAVSGMTVSLHPVAVAGYIGLILNGLALLPVGTTDGGRITQALFGSGVKLFIGNIFLVTIFLVGVLGSDLFLFYFSFLIAFQTGNEIPARNEFDDISFSRVLVATTATVLALLTLIPFQ